MQIDDIVILGSDGLWDNAHNGEIIEVIRDFLNEKDEQPWGKLYSTREAAWRIGRLAANNSYREDYQSPFFVNSGNKEKYLGGKLDDITVICAQIVPESERGK